MRQKFPDLSNDDDGVLTSKVRRVRCVVVVVVVAVVVVVVVVVNSLFDDHAITIPF